MENIQSRLVRLYAKTARELSPGSFQCNLDSSQLSNVIGVALKTVTFRNNVYNIFSSGDRKNIDFNYSINGTPYTSSLTTGDGFYTTVEIMQLLKPLIQANLDIAAPGATVDSFNISTYTKKAQITVTGATMKYTADNTLNITLGNTEDSGDVLTTVPYVFNTFADLGGLESVTVNVKSKSPKTILNPSPDKALYTNSLGVVPVNVAFGLLQTFSQPDLDASRVIFSYPEDLTQLEFKLRDTDGHLLLEQKNSLVIELMVWY
jgi:hypothetical protein